MDALGNTTLLTYAAGMLTSIVDANNNSTTLTYDGARRLTTLTFPDGAYEQYGYTGDNLVASRRDRKNQQIGYGYDHFKRIVSRQYVSGGSVTGTYSGQELMQVVDSTVAPTETSLYGYDTSYRKTSETEGSRGTITYQYNADDSIATRSVQSGPASTYTYYPDGSLNTIVWSPATGSFKYKYTLTGEYQSIAFPNAAKRTYTYDNQGRLTQIQNLDPAGANVAKYSYGYDLNYTTGLFTMLGQRTSMTATVPAQSLTSQQFKYEYTSRYELAKVTYPAAAPFAGEVDSWSYDAIGNRLAATVNGVTTPYTYQKVGANPLNWDRLLNDGTNAYSYDANGGTLSKGSTSFTWDYEGRAAGVTGAATYQYDYLGRRSAKTVGSSTTNFLYSNKDVIGDRGSASAEYLFGPGIDEPLAMSRGGQVYYYDVDGLGSVGLVTNAAGAVQNKYLYDVWGVTRSQTVAVTNPFGYTAREFGEGGTQFYRARLMSPGVGRFMSEDPMVGLSARALGSGRLNRSVLFEGYAYASNAPVASKDPLGLSACDICSQVHDRQMKECWLEYVGESTFCLKFLVFCEGTTLGTLTEACVVEFVICKTLAIAHLFLCTHAADESYETCLKACRCRS